MRFRLPLLLAPLAGLTVSCSPVQTLNNLARTNGLEVTTDRKYGSEPRQVLDVYAPENARNAPVIVFIHGGSWTGGDKSEYRFVGESFARAGYVTAVINYRLAPANRYPAFIQDAARALKWTTQNIAQYGGDPKRLFVTGHSAGAFNAVEVVVNERWLREADVPVANVRGVVGIAGPYDYDFRAFPSRSAFPQDGLPEDIMPSRHVRRDPPPTLLLVAGRDQVVAPENALKMEAALKAAGGEVTREVLPRLDHYTVVGALSRTLTFLGPTRARTLDFIAERARD